jgi:maleylacetoacetate isomerase
MNPSGVPTFFDSEKPETFLTQSLAIMEYLEERYPGELPLLPRDFHARAIVRSICQFIASGIQPLQNLGTIQKVGGKFGEDAKKAWLAEVIGEGMAGLEILLKRHAGTHCFGDSFTMADACLIPQAYACRRFEVDLAKFPTISRVLSVIEKSELCLRTHPDVVPDAPAK